MTAESGYGPRVLLAGRVPGSAGACILTSLLIVTASCASDSPAPTARSTSGSTPNSSTPDVSTTEAGPPAPPASPAEVRENTVTGASAFARHYWATANYATETGNTDALRDLGTKDCSACTDLEHGITRVYERRQTIVGGLVDVRDVVARPGDADIGIVVKVLLAQGKEAVVDASGETVSESPATDSLLIDMVIVWRDSAWGVAEWGASSAP